MQKERMYFRRKSDLIPEFTELLPSPGTPLDCTLVTEGGMYFSAHKAVLSAYSPYLENKLHNRLEDHPIIFLEHVKSKDMENIMEYIYRGELNIPENQTEDFLKTARMLQIKGLSHNGYGDMIMVKPEPTRDAAVEQPHPPLPKTKPVARQPPHKTWGHFNFFKDNKEKRKKSKEEKTHSKRGADVAGTTLNAGNKNNLPAATNPESYESLHTPTLTSEPMWDNYEPINEKLLTRYRKPPITPVELANTEMLKPSSSLVHSTVVSNVQLQPSKKKDAPVQTSGGNVLQLTRCPDCNVGLNPQLPKTHSTYFRCQNRPGWELREGKAECKGCGALVEPQLVELHVKHLCGRRLTGCVYCEERVQDWLGHVTEVHGKSVSALLEDLAQMDESSFLSKVQVQEKPPAMREGTACHQNHWRAADVLGILAMAAMGNAVLSGKTNKRGNM